MNQTELAEYLYMKRNEQGLSIYRLSKLSGVSHSYISQLEKGIKEQPSPEILKKLARALSIDYSLIMAKAGYLEPASPLALWLYDDDEVDQEWEKRVIDKIFKLLNNNSLNFNEKAQLILELISPPPITELKDFLNQDNITFSGVPIDDAYGQRILDILNGLFWEDIQKIRQEED